MTAARPIGVPEGMRWPESAESGAVVEIRGVRKSFGRRTVLHPLDCGFRAGRATAIVGPNAAGKSTLIKIVVGLVRPDAGEVVVAGTPLNGDPSYRERVGYMPQVARFPENLTGRKVIAMLRDLRGASAPLDTGVLEGLGLERELDKPVRTLSGGTRQKLNAALAFLFRPSLLVLDEPTAGLDPLASAFLKDRLVEGRRAGVSILIASHLLGEVEELVDDVLFLSEGRVHFQGPVRRLVEQTGERRLERSIARLMRQAQGAEP